MKTKRKVLLAVVCAVAAVTAVYAAASAGSSSDPLVTLSYLTDKFTPQMESRMDALVQEKAEKLTEQFDAAASGSAGTSSSVFQVVTLSKGKTLVGDVGCEVMLRVGSATCSADGTTGLIDTTDGTTLAGGKSLVKNHLYMVTISTRSVTATADTVKLLVRGPYTIQ
jgi:hypothetical protein